MPAPGKSKMDAKFWKSAGLHLVERNDRGWLAAEKLDIAPYLDRLDGFLRTGKLNKDA